MKKSEINLCEVKGFWENYENILKKHWIFKLFNKNFDNLKLIFMRIMKGL